MSFVGLEFHVTFCKVVNEKSGINFLPVNELSENFGKCLGSLANLFISGNYQETFLLQSIFFEQ